MCFGVLLFWGYNFFFWQVLGVQFSRWCSTKLYTDDSIYSFIPLNIVSKSRIDVHMLNQKDELYHWIFISINNRPKMNPMKTYKFPGKNKNLDCRCDLYHFSIHDHPQLWRQLEPFNWPNWDQLCWYHMYSKSRNFPQGHVDMKLWWPGGMRFIHNMKEREREDEWENYFFFLQFFRGLD